jgi:hypothetical protein
VQKLVLLSAIDKDLYDKIELANGLLSSVKFYINPEIYKAERDIIEKEKIEKETPKEFKKPEAKNLFEDISIMSKATGVLQLPKQLRDLLAQQSAVEAKEAPVEKPEEEDYLG